MAIRKKKGKGKNKGQRGPFAGVKGKRGKLLKQDLKLQQWLAQQNAGMYNPNVNGIFGGQNVTFDAQGRPTTNQYLSAPQEQIKQQGEGLTQMGQGLAQQQLGGYTPFQMGDFNEQRSRIEDAAFGRLTRGLDTEYEYAKSAKEQELHNKGIPFSADPQSRYQQEIGGLDRRYDEQRLSARQQAATAGGQELQRQYGIDLGVHQQGMSDIGALQQQGTGLQVPQYQQYQGQGMDLTNPMSAYIAMGQLKQGNRGLDIQQQQVSQQGRPSGGGGGTPQPQYAPSPFQA